MISAPPATSFPGCVPSLVDPATGVVLRAHTEQDLSAIVEQCNDPQVRRWTTVPLPAGGYRLDDARDFAQSVVPQGWEEHTCSTWVVDAERPGPDGSPLRQYCGAVDLRFKGDGSAEVGFALHPGARGRGVMSSAVRLVVDYGLTVERLTAIRWLAERGNWPSRRVAAAVGFSFDGSVRRLLPHRGELKDAWVATIVAGDPRRPDRRWLQAPTLSGHQVRLRDWRHGDAARVAEACADHRTRHWLVSLPQPYSESDAHDWIELTREAAAAGHAFNWCIADPADDRCLGSVSLEGFGGYARRAEIGYWAHPGARGRGVVTEAVRLVTEFAEESVADSIVIRVADGNTASRHVAEAAGYHYIGALPASEPLGDGTLADLLSFSRP
ncbi:hypothetical protein GCM10009841_11200 [Microlunatus panaciterrae]|uniref:RimJ/RimL family protein N-acetyltransferase n=1 Tax=Microlunatus panaciterrae TaxID=400768 RepID=A0ABS2RM52_9ACTN|nr:GNAT family N-acetyltransferase [Microlunatus panaciterrae]MBM7799677.1 RimJ/RimL family protein N-acetyltransferase [Microlunatus panaciterrae]